MFEAPFAALPQYVNVLQESSMDSFLSHPEFPKALLFSAKPDPSPAFRSLAMQFRRSMRFGMIASPSEAIMSKYDVASLPALVFIKDNTEHVYTGAMKV